MLKLVFLQRLHVCKFALTQGFDSLGNLIHGGSWGEADTVQWNQAENPQGYSHAVGRRAVQAPTLHHCDYGS